MHFRKSFFVAINEFWADVARITITFGKNIEPI